MINLDKGMSIQLKKADDMLKKVRADILWENDSDTVDVDVSCLGVALDGNQKEVLFSEEYFVFYNYLATPDGAITHLGDERNEGGESIVFELAKVPEGVVSIAIFVTIDKAAIRKQSFGNVRSALVRIVNDNNDEVLAEYNLKEDYRKYTAIQVAAFYRNGVDWEFKALGNGMVADLGIILKQYGVKA